jgi:hypothetical protein
MVVCHDMADVFNWLFSVLQCVYVCMYVCMYVYTRFNLNVIFRCIAVHRRFYNSHYQYKYAHIFKSKLSILRTAKTWRDGFSASFGIACTLHVHYVFKTKPNLEEYTIKRKFNEINMKDVKNLYLLLINLISPASTKCASEKRHMCRLS